MSNILKDLNRIKNNLDELKTQGTTLNLNCIKSVLKYMKHNIITKMIGKMGNWILNKEIMRISYNNPIQIEYERFKGFNKNNDDSIFDISIWDSWTGSVVIGYKRSPSKIELWYKKNKWIKTTLNYHGNVSFIKSKTYDTLIIWGNNILMGYIRNDDGFVIVINAMFFPSKIVGLCHQNSLLDPFIYERTHTNKMFFPFKLYSVNDIKYINGDIKEMITDFSPMSNDNFNGLIGFNSNNGYLHFVEDLKVNKTCLINQQLMNDYPNLFDYLEFCIYDGKLLITFFNVFMLIYDWETMVFFSNIDIGKDFMINVMVIRSNLIFNNKNVMMFNHDGLTTVQTINPDSLIAYNIKLKKSNVINNVFNCCSHGGETRSGSIFRFSEDGDEIEFLMFR